MHIICGTRIFSIFATLLIVAQLLCARVSAQDSVLLFPDATPIRLGAFTLFARFHESLMKRHALCAGVVAAQRGALDQLKVGSETRRLIVETVACLPSQLVPAGSPAHRGAVTTALWYAVAPDLPFPTLADRIDSLTLSFEATDFSDPPVWNFCQDSPGPASERSVSILAGAACYNSTDPCSMLTWGPRGATAGQGAEIQWILWKLLRRSPEIVADAFGAEFGSVQRFVRLRRPMVASCDGSSATEHFMCAVWADAKRRQVWDTALLALGRSDAVRRAYKALYAGLEFDGYKIVEYFELWRDAGLRVSEVDYAFFFDRATHIGSPPAKGSAEFANFKSCFASDNARVSPNPIARRCLSLAHPHPTQPIDRAGRDVAYYRTGYGATALTESEVRVWDRHIPLDAVLNFGLSDDRAVEREAVRAIPLPIDDRPPETITDLTDIEKSCPSAIRTPIRRKPL
jgi:hypothetical protein